jgi:radical SAM PhpK family P-methyltransferase
MTGPERLNCVIIGYHEVDFNIFAAKQRKMERTSGGYHEVKANSILLNGTRYTSMDFLNYAIERTQAVNPRLNVFEAPSLGAFYLSSFLQSQGLRTEVVNFFTFQKQRLRELLSMQPDAVAITTTFYIDPDPIIEIVNFIRSYRPETKIIVGGPHVYNSALDFDQTTLQFIFGRIGADIYVIDSQGELTLARVLQCLRARNLAGLQLIPNLLYTLDRRRFIRTLQLPENNDLDESTIDWSRFNATEIAPVAYLRTARSCPFACTFCNYPTMAGKHTVATVDSVERQLAYLHSIGTTDIVFVDDTFNVPLPRFKKILRMMIDHRFGFRWISFFRCSNADEETFDLMKRSGCVAVFLGIESGDPQILKDMNKSATVDRYKWGVRQLHARDIGTFASLICGFPGETRDTVTNTLEFIEETAPTFYNIQLYYHDRRSPMEARATEFQIRGAGYNWRHRSMDWREATGWIQHMYKAVTNSGPLTLYAFSLWAVPYLLAKGISLEQIKSFSYLLKPMLLRSLEDREADFAAVEPDLSRIFSGTEIAGAEAKASVSAAEY